MPPKGFATRRCPRYKERVPNVTSKIAVANAAFGNLATPTGEQAPIHTPEATRGTVSMDSISQKAAYCNTQTQIFPPLSRGAESVGEQMTRIEASVMGDTALQEGERTRLLPASTYSIADFVRKINPVTKKSPAVHGTAGVNYFI